MISFSGGRTSAMMTIELLKLPEYNEDNTVICFANTGKENEATLEFVNEVDMFLGGDKIIWLEFDIIYNEKRNFYNHLCKIVNYETASRSSEPFEKLIKVKKFLPNKAKRFCTQELKIIPINKYMKQLGYSEWRNIIGIRYDEPDRYAELIANSTDERENVAPLYENKILKKDVVKYWDSMPFNLNLKEHQGNCDLCFLKGISKKITILKENPKIADWWIEQEKKTGATFVKGYSVEQLLNKASNQLEIVYQDADYQDCFCNVD